MRKINQQARKVMDVLTKGMSAYGSHLKINNSRDAFMPVVVEGIGEARIGNRSGTLFSVAHYYTQNGDAMRDPEMVFFKDDESGNYFPIMYQQDGLGIYQESMFMEWDTETWKIRPRIQKDQAIFAGIWMRNIKQQQRL